MPTAEALESQVASVMEILAKAAVAEICRVVEKGRVELRGEMCRRLDEIEALRKKVRVLKSERRRALETRVPRCSVGVQAGRERNVAVIEGTMNQPVSEADPQLVVKVEQKEDHRSQTTSQIAVKELTIDEDFFVSAADFPLWASEPLNERNTDCKWSRCCFDAPLVAPAVTHDTELDSRSRFVDRSHAPQMAGDEPDVPSAVSNSVKLECEAACERGRDRMPSHRAGRAVRRSTENPGHQKELPWGGDGSVEMSRVQSEREVGRRVSTCPACGQVFPCFRQLQAHRRSHNGESYQCNPATSTDSVQQGTKAAEDVQGARADWISGREEIPRLELNPLEESLFTRITEQLEEAAKLQVLSQHDEDVSRLQFEVKDEGHAPHGASQVEGGYRSGTRREMHALREGGTEQRGSRLWDGDSEAADSNCVSQLTQAEGPGNGPSVGLRRPHRINTSGWQSVWGHGAEVGCSHLQERKRRESNGNISSSQSRAHVREITPARSGPGTVSLSAGHRLLAKAQRLFHCPTCPKSFGRATDLERHERIHTGEKPFGCGACGKRFSLRCNLITHERVHSGSKPYSCRHCGKGFAQGSNLKAHQRIHTGERPFPCPFCGKRFTQLSSLRTHQRLHDRSGPFS